MSGSINVTTLVGRLVRDPELRKTTSGISYCRFTVACDRQKKKDSQEDPGADFISCVAWRQAADLLTGYAEKGNQVGVIGSIQTGSYTDREGRKVYTTDVLADRVQLLETGGKKKADYPRNGTSVRTEDIGREATQDFGSDSDGVAIDDDDLPF